jgi:hypothetical protein
MDISTVSERDIVFACWVVDYEIYHNKGHFWRGRIRWVKRDCIIDDVLAEIRKDLPKDIK